MHRIYNGPCEDLLLEREKYSLIFADPPDNLGLMYNSYKDEMPKHLYYDWMELIIRRALIKTPIFWLSYYWAHDLEIKYRVRQILRFTHPSFEAKTFLWRYTFGQHRETDCGSGYRFIMRLSLKGTTFHTDGIRETSARQLLGDKRANPDGRVPDDVWEIPRVVGNAKERHPWHPTQHPEALLERIVKMSTKEGETVADLFGGTGSLLRVCQRLGRPCDIFETDKFYCEKISAETGVKICGKPI